jgi:hypothetical protein
VRPTMSYEVLVAIVVINAGLTFSLWRQMGTKANKPAGPHQKAATALWHSDPIVPLHEPPNVPGGKLSSWATDTDKAFFLDFKDFAVVVNWWLADKYVASRFRLQDLPDGDMSLNVDADSGPMIGRCFAVHHNRTRLGRIEIHPSYGYSADNPEVWTSMEIGSTRLLGFFRAN